MDKPPPSSPVIRSGFYQRHKVWIVFIPIMAGLHYAWYMMQQNPKLVPEHERQEFPLIRIGKMIKEKFGFGG